MRRKALVAVLAAALMVAALPASGAIHEITGAECNGKGTEEMPAVSAPGQEKPFSMSEVRALQATGFISSIDVTATAVTVNFDFDVPSSKFMTAGFDLIIVDEIAPGVDLILSPLPIPDPTFAAHANCKNLNP